MDRVARWQQMQQTWARDPFLKNGAAGGNKEGTAPPVQSMAFTCFWTLTALVFIVSSLLLPVGGILSTSVGDLLGALP